jgi:uncharacterized membrane protein YkvA (DUF1232 family)
MIIGPSRPAHAREHQGVDTVPLLSNSNGGHLPIVLRLKHFPRYLLDPEVSLVKKLAILLAVVYVISPADVIPDVIPVIGWLDDIGVMGLLVSWLMRELDRYPAARQAAVK